MTNRFELINPKIEGADTVKLVKTNNVECFELDEELTLCDVVELLDEYDGLLSSISDDVEHYLSQLKAVEKIFPTTNGCCYPKCCRECNYFIVYRNFCGEPSTSSVTMGCRILDDKYELNKPLWKDNHSSFNMRGYNINTLPVIRRGGKVYNLFEIIDVLNGEV